MRQYLNANDIANNIRMMRCIFTGTIILTEGDTDARLFRGFTDEKVCKVLPSHNKSNAIGAIQIIESTGFQGAFAIIDADFDRILNTTYPSKNIFLTDFHDIEMMIIKSHTLEKFLAHYGSEEKLNSFFSNNHISARELLIQAAFILGCFRLYSIQNRLSFTFEKLPYHDFIDKIRINIDLNRMIKVIKNKSQAHNYEESELLKQITIETKKAHDPWEVCCGHDIMNILALVLCGTWGSCKRTDFTQEKLEEKLRLAYELIDLKKTKLYANLLEWETINPGYRIFHTTDDKSILVNSTKVS